MNTDDRTSVLVGDTVVRKGGGPAMRLTRIDGGKAHCEWNEGGVGDVSNEFELNDIERVRTNLYSQGTSAASKALTTEQLFAELHARGVAPEQAAMQLRSLNDSRSVLAHSAAQNELNIKDHRAQQASDYARGVSTAANPNVDTGSGFSGSQATTGTEVRTGKQRK